MIKEVKYFFKENIENRKNIIDLAISSAKSDTKKTTLGMYWLVVKDIVFFVTYGFFMTVIRPGSSELNDMPRLVYLFTGLVAWYLISDNLNRGVRCILANKKIFTKIKFPIMAIPTIETIALYIKRIPTLILLSVILIIIYLTTGFAVHVNIVGLIYALGASFLFGLSYNLLMSGFYTISKDFMELYKAIVRVQFYFVPIFWSVKEIVENLKWLPDWAGDVIYNLPFIHLVESFRNAVVLNQLPHLGSVAIFMSVVIIMFLLGCFIQYRLRKIYSDIV